MSIDNLTSCLNDGRKFSFVRYGDGEWNAILGENRGANVDGQEYSEELTRDLIWSLKVAQERKWPNYYYALNPIARICGTDRIQNFLANEGVEISWLNGDMILEASIEGRLRPFVNALRKHRMIYVGPNHLQEFIGRVFTNSTYIPTPSSNSHSCWKGTANAIIDTIVDETVIAFSNGMATNVIIPHIRKQMDITMIDLGSVWEGYVSGGAKRSHAKRMTPPIIKRNIS